MGACAGQEDYAGLYTPLQTPSADNKLNVQVMPRIFSSPIEPLIDALDQKFSKYETVDVDTSFDVLIAAGSTNYDPSNGKMGQVFKDDVVTADAISYTLYN